MIAVEGELPNERIGCLGRGCDSQSDRRRVLSDALDEASRIPQSWVGPHMAVYQGNPFPRSASHVRESADSAGRVVGVRAATARPQLDQVTVDIYGHLIPGANRAAVDRLDAVPTRNPDATDDVDVEGANGGK
jgi:hypothetical protein